MFGLTEVSGLPAHPLIVHIPVVFVPLALVGALAALVRQRWRSWLLPLVALAAGASVVAVQLAVRSGRYLEGELGESRLIDRHSNLGEQTRPLVIVFFVAATVVAIVDHRIRSSPGGAHAETSGGPSARLASLLLPLCGLSMLTGVLATTWVVRTGGAGTEAVYEGEIGYSERVRDAGDQGDDVGEQGGEAGEEGGDAGEQDGEVTETTESGAGDESDSGSEAGGEAEVSITDFTFDPREITVEVGGEVTWTNEDTAMHTATGVDDPEAFGTEDLGQDDADAITFDEAGAYEYYCDFHQYMTGTVTVTE